MIGLKLKEKKNELQYTLVEQYTDAQLYTFAVLQLADMYTTHRGIKYRCVREMNPFLGDRPTVPKMFAWKTIVLIPAFQFDTKNKTLTKETMRDINKMMSLVIVNNNIVLNRAKRNCSKLS